MFKKESAMKLTLGLLCVPSNLGPLLRNHLQVFVTRFLFSLRLKRGNWKAGDKLDWLKSRKWRGTMQQLSKLFGDFEERDACSDTGRQHCSES